MSQSRLALSPDRPTANLQPMATALIEAEAAAAAGEVPVGAVLLAPNGAVLRRAMKRSLLGRVPAQVDDTVAAGLDLDDLVAAFRAGSSPAQVIAYLRAAAATRQGSSTKVDLPDLERAVEYGDARVWGLALAQDIADYRAGVEEITLLLSPPARDVFAADLRRRIH